MKLVINTSLVLFALPMLLSTTVEASTSRVDPTRPPASVLATLGDREVDRGPRRPSLTLRGIWLSGERATARINEESYRVGDRISGWTVQQITAERVRLVRGDDEIVLTVFASPELTISRENQ